jgi:CheY-like chemotaxis protein
VLIVDDEPDARELGATLLRQAGAEVSAAASAEEAFDLLETLPLDVLISDVAMPGQDGHTLIRRVRASSTPFARIPALALTAYAGPEDARRAVGSGFQAHLPKPAEPRTLTAVVAALARRGASSTPIPPPPRPG